MHEHESNMPNCVVSLSKHGDETRSQRTPPPRGVLRKPHKVGVVAAQAVRADSRVGQDKLSWVLLLDDDPMNTRGLSRWLKHTLGLETRSARTIRQAERWLASMPAPKAIISDFDLEGPDTAVTALRRFRALGVQARTLVLTGAPIRARSALLDAGWVKTPVVSKADFRSTLVEWLSEGTRKQRLG